VKRAADRPADPVPPPAPVFPPTKRARLRKLFLMAAETMTTYERGLSVESP